MRPVVEDFSSLIAQRLRADHAELAARWLVRLVALLPVDPNHVFPTNHLLDHIPQLIVEIADYLEQPAQEEIAANMHVVAKARELGVLRYTQRASVHQIMREYRVFEGVLSTFIREELQITMTAPKPSEVVDVLTRMHQAVSVLQQATLEAFIEQYSDKVAAQRVQLESFNRMVSHELRQPLGALQFALSLLQKEEAKSDAEQSRLLGLLERNANRTLELVTHLTRLSGLPAAEANLQVQRVGLGSLANEVARQLRDMADAKNVEMRVSESLPEATVDVAAIELILVNLISNAIKYSDPAKATRVVEINPVPVARGGYCAFEVRDNGLGIAPEYKTRVFDEHFRAHESQDASLGVNGLGLGLTIVKDCLRSISGTIALESREGEGSVFTVTFPDAAAAAS